ITSLKPSSELFRVDFWLASVDVSNYVQIFTQKSFVRASFNSILISVSVVVIALLLWITASYALGRVRFRGRATVMLT
ncbi:sugar ABC transporter permease, partial [Halomonas sp. ND22Bw]